MMYKGANEIDVWSMRKLATRSKQLQLIPGGDAPIPEGYPGQTMLPLHPHNAALQLWLELGIGSLTICAPK